MTIQFLPSTQVKVELPPDIRAALENVLRLRGKRRGGWRGLLNEWRHTRALVRAIDSLCDNKAVFRYLVYLQLEGGQWRHGDSDQFIDHAVAIYGVAVTPEAASDVR
jgi:hypothetical protein